MKTNIAIISLVLSLIFSNVSASDIAGILRVEEKDIINAVKQELVERGLAEDENLDVEFFGGQTEFQIKEAKEVKILVDNLETDKDSGRFSCNVEIFADRNLHTMSALQGKFFLMTEVWVPAYNIGKGDTITEQSLVAKNIRKSRVKPFMVTNKDKLLGLEAKKSLKEGKIIGENDVGAKILIKRDDVVIAVYRTDKMQITTKAVAQQDGAYGDKIELQNLKTRKLLTGTVQDASTVVIEQ